MKLIATSESPKEKVMKRYWITFLLIGENIPFNHYGKVSLDAFELSTGLMKRAIADLKKANPKISDLILICIAEMTIDDE